MLPAWNSFFTDSRSFTLRGARISEYTKTSEDRTYSETILLVSYQTVCMAFDLTTVTGSRVPLVYLSSVRLPPTYGRVKLTR